MSERVEFGKRTLDEQINAEVFAYRLGLLPSPALLSTLRGTFMKVAYTHFKENPSLGRFPIGQLERLPKRSLKLDKNPKTAAH